MVDFKTGDGREIHPVRHIATFRGKHNQIKSKVLILLQSMPGQYLTARELALKTGCSYDYLKSRLSFWWSWKYLDRTLTVGANRKPAYSYCIASRGQLFVATRIPADSFQQYCHELIDWTKAKKEHPAA